MKNYNPQHTNRCTYQGKISQYILTIGLLFLPTFTLYAQNDYENSNERLINKVFHQHQRKAEITDKTLMIITSGDFERYSLKSRVARIVQHILGREILEIENQTGHSLQIHLSIDDNQFIHDINDNQTLSLNLKRNTLLNNYTLGGVYERFGSYAIEELPLDPTNFYTKIMFSLNFLDIHSIRSVKDVY